MVINLAEYRHMSMPPFASSPRSDKGSPIHHGTSEPKAEMGTTTAESAVSQLIASTLAAQNLRTQQDNAAAQMAMALSKRRAENSEDSTNAKRSRTEEDNTTLPRPSMFQQDQLLSGAANDSSNNGGVQELLRSLQQGNRLSSNGLDTATRLRAELLLQEQAARNSAFLAQLSRPNLGSLLQSQPLTNAQLGGQGLPFGMQNGGFHDQHARLSALRSMAELEALKRSSGFFSQASSQFPQGGGTERQDIAALLQQQQQQSGAAGTRGVQDRVCPPTNPAMATPPVKNQVPDLPLCEEGRVEPYFKRPMFPLGVDEDPNWLSEFHCFVRLELVEVFRASHEDVKARNNSIAYHQVGLRCRFCAHMIPSARAGRSSAFPSSLRQIYQSFTMMLRDHFGNCDVIPNQVQERFAALKDKPAQGATDSKRYWIYSAMKIGMTDSPEGIIINERTRATGKSAPTFGMPPGQPWADDAYRGVSLVLPMDRHLVSEFLFVLMSQVQIIRLTEAERIGNRRSLRLGLPGFGCRFCCEHRRLGLCRMFPARRRTLPTKINDIYDHLRRCTVCPDSVKEHLEKTKHQLNTGYNADQGGDREFFDRIWSRLGHGSNEL